MSLSKSMTTALNEQFNKELDSAYLYESMAAWFYSIRLPGFAGWMTVQAGEERMHAQKLHRYLDENGERVFYAAIAEPPAEWKSPLDAIQATLAHEKKVSHSIHELVRSARKEDDIATETFLGWFVTEQIEEEASAQAVIDKLEMVGDSKIGLYQLDKELGGRQQPATD